MAHFIEVTAPDNKKELINISIIEVVYVHNQKTIVRFKTDNSQGIASMEIKETYDSIKKQLLQ